MEKIYIYILLMLQWSINNSIPCPFPTLKHTTKSNCIGTLYKIHCSVIAIFFVFYILFPFSLSHAQTIIWKIGDPDKSNKEFGTPPRQAIKEYPVPEDWYSRSDWNSVFSPRLCHSDAGTPKEIHITYPYLRDYRYPLLRIWARAVYGYSNQRLIVLKGGIDLSIPDLLRSDYSLFKFPLTPLQRDHNGNNENNKIILKNESSATNPIYFDYLELYDLGEEGDWPLLIRSPDQSVIKWITLRIFQDEGPAPYFEEVCLLDQNCPEFPSCLPEEVFFPYGLFKAKIKTPGENKDISLRVSCTEKLYFSAQFYSYKETVGWHELPTEILDGNSVAVNVDVQWNRGEGEQGALDDPNDFTIIGGLAYPSGMNIILEKNECFISLLSYPSRAFKLAALFLGFFLILFLFFVKHTGRLFSGSNLNQEKDKSFHRFHMKGYVIFLIILSFLFLKAGPAVAIDAVDMKISSSPNPIGSGARALGIGGAFIAIADDATAASWNPGGLLKLKRPEISIVGSYFSREEKYTTSVGEIKDLSDNIKHLNFLSLALPFRYFQRNIVFSLNYQHLYEFSQDTFYNWRFESPSSVTNINWRSHKRQKGVLNTLSPALAVEVIPSLKLGLAANFWLNEELNDHWENINIVRGEGWNPFGSYRAYAELYERYDFSGFNSHIGFLWEINRWLTLGGILKTPFKAKIRHKYKAIIVEEYRENTARNNYFSEAYSENLTLKMPISYGLGISLRLFNKYLMALDIYHTQWEDYLLYDSSDPSGRKISPINNKSKDEADIKSTTQVRLGAEYIIISPEPVIPIRCGVFYDPEPAGGSVDDFYGASIGTGIKYKKFAFDMAYQYRFGNRKGAEDMSGEEISSDIKQHCFYTSMIFYF